MPLRQQVMLIDVNAMVFGMPRALFPVIGTVTFGGDAATVGLLHAAPGAGALLGAVTTGWVSAVRRQGRAVVYAVFCWGLAIVGFGLTRSLTIALVLLGCGRSCRCRLERVSQHDHSAGGAGQPARTAHIVQGGAEQQRPPARDAESGAVAAPTTPAISVVSGGLVSILGTALIARRGRAIWRQTTDGSPPGEEVAGTSRFGR